MTFTLWSRGRLVGVSDLSYARSVPMLRVGDLAPTPFGEKIVPIATGVSPAALELELRGPDGAAVRAEWIAIQDTHFLLSLPDPEECDDDWSSTSLGQLDPAREAALSHLVAVMSVLTYL